MPDLSFHIIDQKRRKKNFFVVLNDMDNGGKEKGVRIFGRRE